MKKVVFLDYDGVVNRKLWSNVDGKWVCRSENEMLSVRSSMI